jgi:hypothetical protein
MNRLLSRQVRTFDASTATTSYQNAGNVVTIAAYKISIVNASTKDVNVSDGSSQDAYYVPAGSSISVGEGLASGPQQEDKQASSRSQSQYQVKLPSGVAGTGIVVITVLGY